MQLTLPKTNAEYKKILKGHWGIDIDRDEIIGKYSLSNNGTQGFLTNCTSVDGKELKYPGDNQSLKILIWANSIKNLIPGHRYKFLAQFAALDKRIQINHFLLVTQRDSVALFETGLSTDNTQLSTALGSKKLNGNLNLVIRDIFNEKLSQNNPYNVIDIAEAVEALAIDIYSENKRFIYELIQNADDAAVVDQSELMIEVNSGFVTLSHNGKPFDERDLRGLCGIGRGTKRDDEAKTGYKGIGFKSVFGQQHGLVYVKTNDLLFRFDRNYILTKGWNPKWGSQKDWETTNQAKFKSPWQLIPILSDSTNNKDVDQILSSESFTVKTAIKIQDENELARDIGEFFSDARFLLFLRKIHKVSLIHGSYRLCIRKEIKYDSSGLLSLYKNDNNISNWYLRTGRYDIPEDIKMELQEDLKSPKKLQEMIRAELSFAFRVEDDLKSIGSLRPSESCIFTYLPTSVIEFGFPFLVNSNFLVDAGREKLHKDRIWNKWLFKVIGCELIRCCAEFARSIDFRNDYLKVLLSDYLPETDHLKKWFNDGLKIGLDKVEFIPNNVNKLVKISDVVIDEVEILTKNIIPVQFITAFINSNRDMIRIEEENFLQVFSGSEKLKQFGAKTFTFSDLKAFVQSQPFFSNHKIENNYSLLKYLKQLDSNDPSGEWNYIIRNNTYIFSDKRTLEKIPRVCFPVTTYVTEFGSENTLIDQELYNSFSHDSDLIDWLKSLGVMEPSELSYLEKEVIGKIDDCIDDQNFLDISEFILGLHAARKLKDVHYNGLRDLPLKTNNGWAKAKDCFLPSTYNPVIDFPSTIDGLTTVSIEYIGRYNAFEWKTLFIAIDVADDINILQNYKIQNTSIEFEDLYFSKAIAFAQEGHSYPRLVHTDPPQNYPAYITYFTFFIQTAHFKYSLLFWDRLISKYSLSVEPNVIIKNSHGPDRESRVYKLNSTLLKSIDLMRWGYYESNRVCIPSFVFWHLQNKPCIPTNQKMCYLASEVFANSVDILELGGDYIPIIKVSKVVSKEWIQLIGLKAKLVLSDLLKILTSVNNDVNERGFFKRENIQRVGLIYNEMIIGMNELSIQDENEIKEWAKKTTFLCNDYVSRRNSDVIWLKIDGFTEYDDKLPTILVPKNVNADSQAEKFFGLLGIAIMDRCDYKVTDEKEDTTLFVKILEFLPALSLILRSRLKIKDEEEFLNKSYKSIENFKFFICMEIHLILNYGDVEVKGSSVKYYLSDEGFYFTNSWRNPLERFNISRYLSTFLKCNGFEQEVQLLLELSDYQTKEYLESVGLSLDLVYDLAIYNTIKDKIRALKGSTNTNASDTDSSTDHKENGEHTADSTDDSKQESEFNDERKQTEYDFIKEVEDFIASELENTEWAEHIPELKNILELSKTQSKEKQKLYNLIAKLKLAKFTSIHFDKADKDFNRLVDGNEKYFVHSARGSFAYIHTTEILRMRDEGFKMALDFGSGTAIKIYETAEEVLSLNTSHLLAYQNEKTMYDLFNFCEDNRDANKRLLIIDRDNSREKSNDIYKLLNPEDDYQ